MVSQARGTNVLHTKIQQINKEVSQQMLQQQFRNKYIAETADEIQEFAGQNPRILKWLFERQRETTEEENLTQRKVTREFEVRKLDTKYFEMLEKREKANFLKSQRNAPRRGM